MPRICARVHVRRRPGVECAVVPARVGDWTSFAPRPPAAPETQGGRRRTGGLRSWVKPRPHHRHELVDVDGLRHVFGCAGGDRLIAIALHRLCGQRDHRTAAGVQPSRPAGAADTGTATAPIAPTAQIVDPVGDAPATASCGRYGRPGRNRALTAATYDSGRANGPSAPRATRAPARRARRAERSDRRRARSGRRR